MKKLLSGILLGGAFLVFIPVFGAQAATLSISPGVGTFQVGQTVTVNVTVSSPTALNAVSGALSFPTERMSVVSVTHANSMVNIWVQEPSYSNSDGSVNFEGVVLNPGYVGSDGNVISIVFRFKTAGPATVKFSAGSILANDGQGTNILNGF